MTTPDALRDAEYIADVCNIPYEEYNNGEGISAGNGNISNAQRKELHAKAKIALLDKLLRNFDILIYGQLSALYYMDCSIIHLVIRAMVQLLFLTPKAGLVPEPTKNQPYVGSILSSNLLCIFLHCISAKPKVDELPRGYLHGGLFIDFVGQQVHSKLFIVAFDCLVLVLQVVMLGIVLEKEDVKLYNSSQSSNDSTPQSQDATNTQDLDSEERGILRSGSEQQPTLAAIGDDIELQNIGLSPSTGMGREDGGLHSDSIGAVGVASERYRHPRDSFMSGQTVIAEMNLLEMLRSQWRRTPGTNMTQSSSEPDEAARILQSRFGVRVVVRP